MVGEGWKLHLDGAGDTCTNPHRLWEGMLVSLNMNKLSRRSNFWSKCEYLVYMALMSVGSQGQEERVRGCVLAGIYPNTEIARRH